MRAQRLGVEVREHRVLGEVHVAHRDPRAGLAARVAAEAVGVDELRADRCCEPAVLELLVEPPQVKRRELAPRGVEPAADVTRPAAVAAQQGTPDHGHDVVFADHAAVVAERQYVGPRDGGAGRERHGDLGEPVVERGHPRVGNRERHEG